MTWEMQMVQPDMAGRHQYHFGPRRGPGGVTIRCTSRDAHNLLNAMNAALTAVESAREIKDYLDREVQVDGSEEMTLLERVRDVVESMESWQRLAMQRAEPASAVGRVNALLGVNLYRVRSFRADVRIDFDEHGDIIAASLLNPDTAEPSGCPAHSPQCDGVDPYCCCVDKHLPAGGA